MDNFNKFIGDAKNISLSKEEKTRMREHLLVYMKEYPATERQHITERSLKWFESLTLMLKPMPLILILALLIGGGTSYAAEGALPGDALYAVKVNVNEEVRGWLAASDQDKASWEAKRADRRLTEAEELAADGRLDSEVQARVAFNFDTHAERVQERIETFEANEDFKAAVDISAKFETSLRAHENILERLAERQDEAQSRIVALQKKVKIGADAALHVRVKAEEGVSSDVSTEGRTFAEGKMHAAENKVAEVKRYLTRIKTALGMEATAKADARLVVAEDVLAEGEAKFDASAYGEAFVLFQEAHDIAQEAKLLIEARKNLNIEVKFNSDARNQRIRIEQKDDNSSESNADDDNDADDADDDSSESKDEKNATSTKADIELEVKLNDIRLDIRDIESGIESETDAKGTLRLGF